MPQAMRRQVGERVLPNSPPERLVHPLGVERAGIRLAEDEVLIDEARPDQGPLVEHSLTVVTEHADGDRVQRDRSPASRCLGLAGDHLPADRTEGVRDAGPTSVEIDVAPMEDSRSSHERARTSHRP